VYELVVLGLVTILISPVSWRHHYLLTLIPVIYLWVMMGERWRDIIVLSAATLAMGTVFPDYVIVASTNPALGLVLSSLIPVASFLLLLVLCKNYGNSDVPSPSIDYPSSPP
jgi:L-lactate permease